MGLVQMKKITMSMMLLICFFAADAQIIIQTDEVLIMLPKAVKEVDQQQLVSRPDGTVSQIKGGDYEYDGLYFDIKHFKLDGNVKRLEELKAASENRMKKLGIMDTYYQGKIGSVNENNVLTMRIKGGESNYYLFYVTNKTFTYEVNGMLQFEIGKEKKAKDHLEKILNSILKVGK